MVNIILVTGLVMSIESVKERNYLFYLTDEKYLMGISLCPNVYRISAAAPRAVVDQLLGLLLMIAAAVAVVVVVVVVVVVIVIPLCIH